MGFLRTVKDEYIGGLRFSGEIKEKFLYSKKYICRTKTFWKDFNILKEVQSLQEYGERVVYASFYDPFFSDIDLRKFAEYVKKEYLQGKVHLFLDEIRE